MGPKLDWTHDNKRYEQFHDWKQQIELIFTSALKNTRDSIRTSSVKYWFGKESFSLIKEWTAEGKPICIVPEKKK